MVELQGGETVVKECYLWGGRCKTHDVKLTRQLTMKKIKKKDVSNITQKVTQLICEVRERLLTAGRHEMSYSGEDAKNVNFVEGGMMKR